MREPLFPSLKQGPGVRVWKLQKRSLRLLEPRIRRKFIAAILIQSSLGLFDVIGVLLIGVIGTLASVVYSDSATPMQVEALLKILKLANQEPSTSIMILSFFALGFFLVKTGLALFLTKRTFTFLATQQSRISSALVEKILNSEYVWLRNQEPHVLSTTVILGVSAATVNALGQILILCAEFALVVLFTVLLIVVNPIIALFTFFYMAGVLSTMNSVIGKRVSLFNQNQGRLRLESERNFYNALKLFREIRVFKRSSWFEEKFRDTFTQQAHYYSADIWIQQIPKYALEIAMLIGASGLLVAGRFSSNSEQIIPILVIYLASSIRIFPSLIRIQSSVFSLKSHAFYGEKALTLIDNFADQQRTFTPTPDDIQIPDSMTGVTRIELKNVGFSYPDSDTHILNDLSFMVSPGERVAIVGPSGAGKSTLCDIFLGLLRPTTGTITIGGLLADEWIRNNVGSISYLPQEVTLIGGTLLDNICLGISDFEIDAESVSRSIERAQLTDFVGTLPEGINTDLGVNGIKISGGQKQRIGIARALYSKPTVLVMDEATSALDAETEHGVMKVLESLGTEVTLIFIAHRLSSIRDFPRVLYFEEGNLLADGDFQQVRLQVSRFNAQAELFGL